MRIFSLEQAREMAPRVNLKESYLVESLFHLRQNGWIQTLRRGLYAIAPTLPGLAPAHEFEIAMALVQPAAISHWSALHHHGLTEQIPSRVFVLTTTEANAPRISSRRNLAGKTAYRFIRVSPKRFFGTEEKWFGEARVTITDLERTLIDALVAPQYCGDFAEVLHAFSEARTRWNFDRLRDYALRWDGAVAKRLGWVLEKQGMSSVELEPLRQVTIRGYRKLDASAPPGGRHDARWMVQENLPGGRH